MNKKYVLFILASIISMMKSMYGFVVLAFPLIAIPALGAAGAAGLSKKASVEARVKNTLNNVDSMMFYLKIFLFVVAIVGTILFVLWLIKTIRRYYRKKSCGEAIAILHKVQSDLSLLQMQKSFGDDELYKIELTHKEGLNYLKQLLKKPYFIKLLGTHPRERMLNALNVLREGKAKLDEEMVLITQWLKTFRDIS